MDLSWIKNGLPPKRDMHWFVLMIPVVAVTMLAFVITSKLQLHLTITSVDLGIWFILSVISAGAICGFAYAGLKIASLFSIAGTVCGLAYMSYVFAQPIEARGIVGLISGADLAFILIVVGVNAQMIHYIIKKRGETV